MKQHLSMILPTFKAKNKEEIFALIYPGDVNYDLENENSVKIYEEMTSDLQEENFTFELNN